MCFQICRRMWCWQNCSSFTGSSLSHVFHVFRVLSLPTVHLKTLSACIQFYIALHSLGRLWPILRVGWSCLWTLEALLQRSAIKGKEGQCLLYHSFCPHWSLWHYQKANKPDNMTDQFRAVFKANPDWLRQRGKLRELHVSCVALHLLSFEYYSDCLWG